MNQATRKLQDTAVEGTLYVAFELSKKTWKLAFSDGSARPPRLVNVPAPELGRVSEEIGKAKVL